MAATTEPAAVPHPHEQSAARTVQAQGIRQSHWLWILGIIGLDYFSTLGYQPSLGYEAAGLLSPLATAVVVLITLLGVLPVYAYVAGKSPNGQGSLALLERLIPGWKGKLLILVLLGFAATDFIFTRTLSLADAAEHINHNPNRFWQDILNSLSRLGSVVKPHLPAFGQHLVNYWDRQMVVTVLLLLLCFAFWALFRRGFTRNVIRLAGPIVGLYLLLNAVVVGSGLLYLANHPDILERWFQLVTESYAKVEGSSLERTDWLTIATLSVLLFPKMALGLSGFELSMVVMPLIKGKPGDTPEYPRGRIRNTRKLLVASALIMSFFLLGSALVTTTLISSAAFDETGPARNRALAFLAHGGGIDEINPLFGPWFGTLYDLSTVLILCFAGTSVVVGLRDLVPHYLHRLGMELDWAHKIGATLHILGLIKLYVTVVYRADVETQRGAYATSVLVLITSACLATALDRWRRRSGPWPLRLPWYFAFITGIFLITTAAMLLSRPVGLQIAAGFILAILASSVISRLVRSTELRFEGFEFVDEQSRFLWESMEYLQFPILVPHRPGRRSLASKEEAIRQRHRLTPDMPVVFVESHLGDASDFYQRPLLEVQQQEGRFVLRVTRCASIAHVIAAVALELSKGGKPPEVHFGWSDENPITANLDFVLFGQGNVPWLVHELLRKAVPQPERRPRVIVG